MTNWLCHSCLVDLIDVTLACEYANSILIEVVTAHAEKPVDNSLMQIWKLKFCRRDESLFRLWAQGLVEILKLKFRRDFEAEVKSVLCCWCLVEVMKLNLSRNTSRWCLFEKMKFGQDLWKNLWYELHPRVLGLSVRVILYFCRCLYLYLCVFVFNFISHLLDPISTSALWEWHAELAESFSHKRLNLETLLAFK